MAWGVRIGRVLRVAAAMVAACGMARASDSPADDSGAVPPSGALIWKRQCAGCHGAHGEGAPAGGIEDAYAEPLFGDLSLDELARFIDESMPAKHPELCQGEAAAQVAAYIFDAFYSAAARQRQFPLQRAPARLTNRQWRESLADLFASFTDTPRDGAEDGAESRVQQGLRGEYFQSEGMNKKKESKLKRIDGEIDFDWGAEAPVEGMGTEAFSIAWDGSLWTRETGEYHFRVSTPNGARLYVNADLRPGDFNRRDDSDAPSRRPLIDAWVTLGPEVRRPTASLFLLGGRRYAIRLDYFKYKEPSASLRLEWKTPYGEWEVIRGDALDPFQPPRVTVVASALPPDDRSHGYERGTSVSQQWLSGVTKGALQAANEAVERIDALSSSSAGKADRLKHLRTFAERFAARAWRRPLYDAEQSDLLAKEFAASPSPEAAVRRIVLRTLTSPRFLYPDLVANDSDTPHGYGAAARLALVVWDSLPDQALLDAAQTGQLESTEQLRAQAERMLNDPRTRAKMSAFFHYWLEMDGERDLSKDQTSFPEFTPEAASDLRRSLDLFLEQTLWSEGSDYRRLLLDDRLYLNDRLRRIYGAEEAPDNSDGEVDSNGALEKSRAGPDENKRSDELADHAASGDFQTQTFTDQQRAGVLTHPYLLTSFAYYNSSSPIHRGVFLTRHIVGRRLKPPPQAVAFNPAAFDPTLTMREKVTELTRDQACMACHEVINPLGFSLECYDAIGRWRTQDNAKPVDPSGVYTALDGIEVPLGGPRDVAEYAAQTPDAHRAFVRHLFQFMVKQPPEAFRFDTVENLTRRFAANAFNMQQLIVDVAVVASTERGER